MGRLVAIHTESYIDNENITQNNIINVASQDLIYTSYIGRMIMFITSYVYTDYISIIRFVTALISQLVMLISTYLATVLLTRM